MPQTNEIGDRTLENGAIVLLARIVDRDCSSIRPSDLAAVEYSICEVDPRWPGDGTIIGGHEAVAINADDVVFDALRNDGEWTVDEVGYNFRHEVALGKNVVSSQADGYYEVRYVLTPTTGEKTIVRFQLKVV